MSNKRRIDPKKYLKLSKEKRSKLSLSVRLTLFVCAEIVFCILLAIGFDELIGHTIFNDWRGTLVIELLVVSVIVGSIVTGFVSIYFFNPIKKLRGAMTKVAEGDFSVRLEAGKSTSSDVKEVFAGFNIMVKELESTEILQSDFVSNVSHEFKTPINAIEGYTTLLQGCESLDPDQQEYVDKILFNTKRLSTLVGNILLLSKIENQNIKTNVTKFRLDEQIRQALLALEPAWTEKDIEFDVEMDTVDYNGSENLLIHVWSNLIGNAIKFSPKGGKVKIGLKQNERIVFTVEDNGCGIAENEKSHLFDKFYQGDSSHKQEGNGLGLALVKRIVTLAEGEIFAENTENGCKFTVVL